VKNIIIKPKSDSSANIAIVKVILVAAIILVAMWGSYYLYKNLQSEESEELAPGTFMEYDVSALGEYVADGTYLYEVKGQSADQYYMMVTQKYMAALNGIVLKQVDDEKITAKEKNSESDEEWTYAGKETIDTKFGSKTVDVLKNSNGTVIDYCGVDDGIEYRFTVQLDSFTLAYDLVDYKIMSQTSYTESVQIGSISLFKFTGNSGVYEGLSGFMKQVLVGESSEGYVFEQFTTLYKGSDIVEDSDILFWSDNSYNPYDDAVKVGDMTIKTIHGQKDCAIMKIIGEDDVTLSYVDKESFKVYRLEITYETGTFTLDLDSVDNPLG